jgi:hypothetical protein
MSLRAPLVLLLGTACQFPQANETGFGSDVVLTAPSTGEVASGSSEGSEGAPNHGSSTGDGSASTSTGNDTAEDTNTSILDVGNSEDLGDGSKLGCQGKIDFLFVISRAMEYHQSQLIDALPKFIATIDTRFADFDYHIMVLDGDGEWGLARCTEDCVEVGSCEVKNYPCDHLDLVTQCDGMIGAGNVFSAGGYAYNEPCEIAGGKRFLTRDQPNLAETFQCIGQVGISGRGAIGQALATAMSTQLGGIGGCNDGFLRDDALLMVTMIGGWDVEGYNWASTGTPEAWAQAVVDAKNSQPDSVVMLDIGDATLPWQDRIWKLTKMFKYGLVTDVRDSDYGPAFAAAMDLVDEACAGFVPPS